MPYNCPIGSASMIFSIFTVLQPSLKSNVSIFLSTKKKLCIQEQSLLNVLSNLPYFWFRQPLIYFLEKSVVPHSITLALKLPWMEEPGGLQSMGSLRVGYDSATSLSLFTFMHWRRQCQPTPVFLPGESQGRGSLLGCRLWGRTESDTTEAT